MMYVDKDMAELRRQNAIFREALESYVKISDGGRRAREALEKCPEVEKYFETSDDMFEHYN
jgi:pantoate kinase